jgi:hypothetical protein
MRRMVGVDKVFLKGHQCSDCAWFSSDQQIDEPRRERKPTKRTTVHRHDPDGVMSFFADDYALEMASALSR